MSDFLPLAEPLEGRCLCGAVSITVTGARPLVDVCHCGMCRHWGGLGLATVTGEDFTVDGEDKVTAFRSSDWAERAFCSGCGSNLWFRFLPADHYSFLAGLFELPDSFAMGRQIFIDSKPGWYDFAQDTPQADRRRSDRRSQEKGFEFDN